MCGQPEKLAADNAAVYRLKPGGKVLNTCIVRCLSSFICCVMITIEKTCGEKNRTHCTADFTKTADAAAEGTDHPKQSFLFKREIIREGKCSGLRTIVALQEKGFCLIPSGYRRGPLPMIIGLILG